MTLPDPQSHSEPYPKVAAADVGWLTEAQMVEVDLVMVEDLGIELLQMMENAGRNLARVVLDLYDPKSVRVFAGTGGNGGGGLVAARHLANAGVSVSLRLSRDPDDYAGVPAHQLDILERMGLEIDGFDGRVPGRTDVAIDALIGYSLRGAPRGRTAELMADLGDSADHIVSLDTPSGLDVTTGEQPGAVVEADATLTLALPKAGLREAACVGELFLADISVPPEVMVVLGATPPDFRESAILHVERHASRLS